MTSDVTISFKLPYALKMQIRKAAKAQGKHQTTFLLELVNSYFDPQIRPEKLIKHITDNDNTTTKG